MTMHASKGKATPASAATKRAVVKTVRACLTEAVKRGHIDKNPARYVALPPAEETVPEPLTTEEIRALVHVCQHRRNGARWLVAFASELRQSAMAGCQFRPEHPHDPPHARQASVAPRLQTDTPVRSIHRRSEERRVGKEWSSGWTTPRGA